MINIMQEQLKIKIALPNGSWPIQCKGGFAYIENLDIKIPTSICGNATLVVYRCKAILIVD
mgnify:CR=1 FL=1